MAGRDALPGVIGRRLVLGMLLGGSLTAFARAQGEENTDASEAEDPDVFGARLLRADEDAVRASGSLGGWMGAWMIEIRVRTTTGPALRKATWKRGRLMDQTVSISLREYRQLKARALALYQQEAARDAEDRAEEDRLHEQDPSAPYTVGALCLDGPTVRVEIGSVGDAVAMLDGKGCYGPEEDSAGSQIGRLLEAAARRHGI